MLWYCATFMHHLCYFYSVHHKHRDPCLLWIIFTYLVIYCLSPFVYSLWSFLHRFSSLLLELEFFIPPNIFLFFSSRLFPGELWLEMCLHRLHLMLNRGFFSVDKTEWYFHRQHFLLYILVILSYIPVNLNLVLDASEVSRWWFVCR